MEYYEISTSLLQNKAFNYTLINTYEVVTPITESVNFNYFTSFMKASENGL
jgi:hypothetical protein